MEKLDSTLMSEILDRAKQEQDLRRLGAEEGYSPDIVARLKQVDADNTIFIKEFVHTHGWPKISETGKEVAEAVWLMVQHSPDVNFMEKCLRMMETMLDEVEPTNLVRTIDRVRILKGKPQYYGTHFRQKADGTHEVIRPIEDEENVDERRRALGMPSIREKLEQYDEEIRAR